MPSICWNEELNLGIKDVDDQHKKFLEIVNELLQAMQEKKAQKVQSDIIDKLLSYAFYHFTKEERILNDSKYPFINEHKREHEAFVDKISQFKKNFDDKKITLSIEMINFMNKWWINHIKVSDKKYMPYVKDEELIH